MIYKTIIVDDEPHARRYLSELLQSDDEVNEIGQFGNGKEALKFLSDNAVDIIFLDIEMPNVNGLEVVRSLPEEHLAEIIFTTAYNQYAITAFEAQALDYLLKPFDEKRLIKALSRAKAQIDLKANDQLHRKISLLYEDFNAAKSPQLSEFILKEKGLEFKVRSNKIQAIQAESVYVELITQNNRHLYRIAMNDLEKQLPKNFLRIHRSTIINMDFLKKWKYQNNSTFLFEMYNGESFSSARGYLDKVKSALKEREPQQ